ncbi:hypothetical protein GQ457_07G042590 [Hibiscus cannabinus]
MLSFPTVVKHDQFQAPAEILNNSLLLLLFLPRNPMAATDDEEAMEMEAKPFSFSTESGGSKHEIEVVKKRGGGAADGAHGGGGGGDNGKGAGGQIPVYAAGSMNHNRGHRHHGSNSGTNPLTVLARVA